MGERARRRRRVALAGLGGAAVLAVLGLWLSRAGSAGGPARTAIMAAPPAAPPPAVPEPAAAGPVPDLEDLPEPIRRFLEATPYPTTSGRLTRDHADLLEPGRRYERHRPIPDTIGREPGGVVTWLFTADRWAYVGPEVVHARLEVLRGGELLEVEVLEASAVREDGAGATGSPVPLDFQREGDVLVAELPLARFADHHGPILLAVRFVYEDELQHEDTLRVFSTPASRIPGRLTGVGDSVRDGSLRIDVAAELDQPGFYRFDANLYDANGEPVAFATFKGELDVGSGSVPLEVYGRVLHDAGVSGPYTVGEVRGYRFLDGQYPDREELPALPDRFETAAYPLAAFTDVPFTSEHELHLVDLMLDDLEQGRALVLPEAAAAAQPAAPLPPAAP